MLKNEQPTPNYRNHIFRWNLLGVPYGKNQINKGDIYTMKKTFKLGEYCAGGIIQVMIPENKNLVRIRNATMTGETIEIRQFRWELDSFKLELYLNELTTSYYASKIRDWVTINARLSALSGVSS